MSNAMYPQYSTVLFTDVWDSYESFLEDLNSTPFTGAITRTEILFYLLYARYGNTPIANYDTNQWKFKVFSVIYQYGPTWEKRLSMQEALRGISEADLLKGSGAVYNHAFNPSTTPSTGSLDELTYINDQNTTKYKKSKMDAYEQLLTLLETDVTEDFIRRFAICFKKFVAPEQPLLYVMDDEEEE